jgi:opacity protein-like surface antigen
MKSATRVIGSFVTAALLSTGAVASEFAQKSDEFVFLPIFTDDNWKANVEIAAVVGYADYSSDSAAGDDTVYGLEVSFDCPVFTLPGEHILRQQLMVEKGDEDGFKTTRIEMNPYYSIPLSEKLLFGIGPGIGGIKGETAGGSDWAFSYHVGAGVKYYLTDDVLVGLDVRQQWTAEKEFGTGVKQDLDSLRTFVKVGYRF